MQAIKRRYRSIRSRDRRVWRTNVERNNKNILQAGPMCKIAGTGLSWREKQSDVLSGEVQEFLNYCPVCGYKMPYPPIEYNICFCCGTEFGYEDSGVSHEKLRGKWLRRGAVWWSQDFRSPDGWDPFLQLISRFGVTEIMHCPTGQLQTDRYFSGDASGSIDASRQVPPLYSNYSGYGRPAYG